MPEVVEAFFSYEAINTEKNIVLYHQHIWNVTVMKNCIN